MGVVSVRTAAAMGLVALVGSAWTTAGQSPEDLSPSVVAASAITPYAESSPWGADPVFGEPRPTPVEVAAIPAPSAIATPDVERLAWARDRASRGATVRRAIARWPVWGRLSARFGQRGHMWSWGWHTGLDIVVPVGTSVRAPLDGTVTFAGWRGPYGRMIVVDHGNGVVTRYAHLSRFVVRSGAVTRGEVIARSGASGNVSGPHVHMEPFVDGQLANPLPWLLRTQSVPVWTLNATTTSEA